jgi:predicted dinucleotide-binding enzyme
MKIAVLGTGMVGRSLAAKLAEIGHEVFMGTRDVQATLSINEIDSLGNPPLNQWLPLHQNVTLLSFAQAAKKAELIFLPTHGSTTQKVLSTIDSMDLDGKTVIDVSNSLIFGEQGEFPHLEITSTTSIGESLQQAFTKANIVKALNNIQHSLMVDPTMITGNHNVFISGNNQKAKYETKSLLTEFGWSESQMIDLGGIIYARAMEMNVLLWWRMYEILGTGDFNFEIKLKS